MKITECSGKHKWKYLQQLWTKEKVDNLKYLQHFSNNLAEINSNYAWKDTFSLLHFQNFKNCQINFSGFMYFS